MLYIKNIKLSIVAVITIMCILLTTDTLQATHVVGGNLYYECLGNNNYRITFEMRRDCFNGATNAQFDDPANIAVYDGDGNLMQNIGRFGQIQIPFSSTDTLNEILTSECRVFGEDVCVHTTRYEKIVNLPANETGYVLVYQRCCRNNTLNNIIDPLEQGATYSVDLTTEAMRLCNSTPQFTEWPDIYLCNNDWYRFDHSAIDNDGDSLVYELCVPFVGGTIDDPKPNPASAPPHAQVVWSPPYNLENMMGGVAPLKIDSKTGMLSVRPDVIGQFLIGVCVKEYRNGELLSVVKRDFEFNTRLCNDSPRANFTAQPSPNCDGLEVGFTNNSTSDRDYIWYFDYDGDRSLTSTEENPNFRYSESGLYKVRLEVTDGECLDVFRQNIGVSARGDLEPDFEISSDDCGDDFSFNIKDITNSSQRIISREWTVDYGGFVRKENTSEFIIRLPKEDRTAVITYTITGESGCVKTITRSIDLHYLETTLVDTDITICKGESIELIDQVDEDFTYTWSPRQGLDLRDPRRPIATPTTSTDYVLTLSDGICNTKIDVPVRVDDDRDLVVTGADVACNGIVTLEAFSDSANRFEWFADPEYTTSLGTANPINLILADIPEIVYVRTNENKACNFLEIDLSDILVTDEIGLQISNNEAIPTCEGEEVVLSATTLLNTTFSWLNENGREVGTGPNVTIVPRNNEVFTVIATDRNGCQEMASFKATIANEIDLNLSIDQNEIDRCFGDQLDVTAISADDVTIQWFEDGVVVADGQRLLLPVEDSAIFRAVATDNLGCSTSKELIVNVADDIEFITNTDDDGNANYCYNESITLIATGTDNLRYEWFDIDGNSLGRGAELLVEGNENQIIKVVATDENGCTKEALVNVNVYDDFEIIFDSEEVIYCPSLPAELSISSDVAVTVIWFDAGGNVIGSGTDFSYETAEATTVNAVVFSPDGCTKEQAFILSPLTIEYINPESVTICVGESTTIEFLDNGITTPLTFDWDNKDAVSDFEPVGNLTVNPAETTVFTVTATSSTGCEYVASTEVIVNDFGESLEVTADPEKVAVGQTIQLEVEDIFGYEYEWSQPSTLDDPNIYNPTATPIDENGTYTVTVTDENGCEGTASVTVEVVTAVCNEDDVWLPNMFTPNGDGSNDIFKAESNFVDEFEMIIYNRWGEQIFISNNIASGWNGTYKGKQLEPDVYGYCIRATCTNGVDYVTQGNVTIVK